MTNASEAILRTDSKGRVHTPPERRESLLDEFERSGLSGAKFAELAGIKYQTFAAWVARRRQQRGVASAPAKALDSVRWLEAVVSDAQAPTAHPTAPLKLRLPTGAWIEVSDFTQVNLAAALVQALEKPPVAC